MNWRFALKAALHDFTMSHDGRMPTVDEFKTIIASIKER
jgi:hypothetical protein